MRYIILMAATALSGCVSSMILNIPDFSKIEDNHKTLIAETTDIGLQTLYENQSLTHYIVGKTNVYCSELFSMDKDKYRCFSLEGKNLTQGMNPLTFKLAPLKTVVPVKFAALHQ
ncbi:hypothetical protein [Geopsychrobacter electrodiphilus]|uniref:hypothetical protein n=1 Tax=Geopsychrobacter electrodiphilus TaxID=225196 RepID=UPI00036E93AA|nr:hypothetical protein [Geopsychrobacter electrodiphilus]